MVNRKMFGLRVRLLFVLSVLFISACKNSALIEIEALPTPTNLKHGEGAGIVLGHYEQKPRFSWKIPENEQVIFQSAYQIQVFSSGYFQQLEEADLWDSGKVLSDEMNWIRYEGKQLHSRQKLFWRVRYWGERSAPSEWSELKQFELGLLSRDDWSGMWIGHPATSLDTRPTQEVLATPQYLRKRFKVGEGVKSARLYVSAKGVFKPFLNGSSVAPNDAMMPGWTPYAKRIEALTYDVTNDLKNGENVLASSLAGGWYSGRVAHFKDAEHRAPPRFLAQLEITYLDGRVQTIVSDNSWKASQNGPIRFASIYDGETYDQRYEFPDWALAKFDESGWVNVLTEQLDKGVAIEAKRHAPVRVTSELPAISVSASGDGRLIFDFGQNMVGVPYFKIPVLAGEKVTVRFAEALNKNEFYTDNYRSAESRIEIFPDTDGYLDYQPTFTYFGYRYIEVSGHDSAVKPELDWVRALILHSDVKIHANFESSHAKLNKLSQNILWGMRSNFFDIPLDCPQRDERLGWTGDAQVFVTSSMYMADVYGFWASWLQSVREEQGKDGKIPLYIPYVEWLSFASSGWGDAVTIIPWELYMVTGDEAILADNYDMMLGWLNYHKAQSENYISNMNTFGDWLQPFPKVMGPNNNGNRGDTNFDLIGTAYYARSVELVIKSAQVLGKEKDVAKLEVLLGNIKQAFFEHFFDEQLNMKVGEVTQTSYLLGLAYDLFPEESRALAVSKLIDQINQADRHLRTGFLGTPLLGPVLQEAGHSELFYDLLFNETYPSWFYSINNGATTTWERWDSYSLEDGFSSHGMNSLNHYAYGTVSRWFYEGILGIKPLEAGFKKIVIEPQISSRLHHASGGYETPYGEVRVSWRIAGEQLLLDVVVPQNTTANIKLPDNASRSLELNGLISEAESLVGVMPGTYNVVVKLGQ